MISEAGQVASAMVLTPLTAPLGALHGSECSSSSSSSSSSSLSPHQPVPIQVESKSSCTCMSSSEHCIEHGILSEVECGEGRRLHVRHRSMTVEPADSRLFRCMGAALWPSSLACVREISNNESMRKAAGMYPSCPHNASL
eukprot:767893-Hanusia_phi.AAC.4